MARPKHEQRSEEPLRDPELPDIDAPESVRPRSGKLRRLFSTTPVMMAFATLLLIAVAALSWYATQWKRQVTVNRVVVSGVSLIPASGIERRLNRFKGENLDEIRTEDVRRALAPESYIRQMQISKELNGILRVRIKERRPAALVADAGRNLIIDTEGYLLPDEKVSGRFRLVTVYGVRTGGVRQLNEKDRSLLFALLDAFDRSAYARMMVSGIHLARDNQTWFTVAGSPIRFVIGNDGNFKEKLKKFEIFWQKVVAKKGIDCYDSVDLRFRQRVFATSPVSEAESADSSAAPVAPPASGQLPDERH
jgi:cell division protein FtsQ